MSKKRKWIQKAGVKRGALSRQLAISEKENIPISLLKKINKAKAGTTVKNPSRRGKREYKVTPLMKKRANLAINLKNIRRRKRKK